jgi:hypothetical protein
MRTSSSLGMAARTWPLAGVERSRRYRGSVALGIVGAVFSVGAGDRPIGGPVGVAASSPILPSISERWVILKVPASCVSDTVGVVNPTGVSTAVSMLSPSSMLMSWILTDDWMSVVVTVETSAPDSSDPILSALGSSCSPVMDVWCRIEGRLRDRGVGVDWDVGRTVGDRIWAGGRGVVGDSGWDARPPWYPGTIDGSRSASLMGRRLKPSAASIDGIAVARGWMLWRDGKWCGRASWPRW